MSGLVGHWPLHEQSGRANDLSGNNNHGTVNGATQGVAGRGGLTAYSFNGSGDHIVWPNSVDDHMDGSSDFTISAWAYPTATHSNNDNNFVFVARNDSSVYLKEDNGSWQGNVQDGGGGNNGVVGSSLVLNEWVLLTLVFESGGDLVLYENGQETARTTHGITSTNSFSQGVMTSRAPWDTKGYFDGSICDMRIYNRALSPTEISTLYEWGSGDYARPPSDGVAYYALDGDVTDSWNTNDLTNNGVSFVSDSIRGQAGLFEPSNNDYLTISNFLGNVFTISAWTKNETSSLSGEESIMQTYDNFSNAIEGSRFQYSDQNGGEVQGDYGDGSTSSSRLRGEAYNGNGWVHHTYVVDADSGYHALYTNGTIVGESSSAPQITIDHGPDMEIGREPQSGGEFWNGNMDDIRIYDYALDPSQVYELYRWGTFGRDMRADLVKA